MMTMASEPTTLAKKLWHASLLVLGATIALWLSVQILLRIWLVIAIATAVIVMVWLLARWWYFRS